MSPVPWPGPTGQSARLELTLRLREYAQPGAVLEVVINAAPHVGQAQCPQVIKIPLESFFKRGGQVQEYLPSPLPDQLA